MPRADRIEFEPKTCALPTCSTTFERQPDQTTTQFRRKRYCSPEHRDEGQRLRLAAERQARERLAAARETAAPEPAPTLQPEARWRPEGFTPEPCTWYPGQAS